ARAPGSRLPLLILGPDGSGPIVSVSASHAVAGAGGGDGRRACVQPTGIGRRFRANARRRVRRPSSGSGARIPPDVAASAGSAKLQLDPPLFTMPDGPPGILFFMFLIVSPEKLSCAILGSFFAKSNSGSFRPLW